MNTDYSISINGSNALVPNRHEHLRLVYDSRYDSAAREKSQKARREAPAGAARALVIVVAALLVMGLVSTIASNMHYITQQEALSTMRTEVITIVPGDTLWSVASNHGAAGIGTADVVEWLKCRNDLHSSSLTPGQRLIVPLAAQNAGAPAQVR